MTDITLQHMTNGQNISTANTNFDKLQDNINNHSLQKDGGNNVLFQDLDLNGHDLLNVNSNVSKPNALLTVSNGDARYYQQHAVPTPSGSSDATNKSYVDTAIASASVGIPPSSIATYPVLNATYAAAYVVADGVANDATNLQNAINAANSAGKELIATGLTMRITSQVVIPTTLRADFSGSKILTDTMTSGSAIKVNGSLNTPAGTSAGHIRGLTLMGKFTSGHQDPTFNVDGISFDGTGGQTSDLAWYDLKVFGFRDCVAFSAVNTYLLQFHNLQAGWAWRRGVAYYATTNSGENINFHGGSIFNCNNTSFTGTGFYIDSASGTLDASFHGLSFDYNDLSADVKNCRLAFHGCHFENNNNLPHITTTFVGGGEKPQVVITGGSLGGGPGTNSWTGITVEGVNGRPALIKTVNGGLNLFIDGTKVGGFYTTVPYSTELVNISDGIANRAIKLSPCLDSSLGSVGSGLPLTLSNSINALYVAGAGSTTAWNTGIIGSGNTVSADATTFVSPDTGSRKLANANGNSGGIYQTIPVTGGQNFIVKANVKATGLTGGGATLRLQFFANDGTTNIQDIILSRQVTTNTSFAEVSYVGVVPNGATTMRYIDWLLTGTNIGANVWFSNEHLWLY